MATRRGGECADDAPRKHVVIVGGGMAGLVAAWDLTRRRGRGARCDVTVIQPGWRLGGKGASGRRVTAQGARIEEHGLHMWSGLYANAFEILHDCYDELGRNDTFPISRIDQAFQPASGVGVFESWRGTWTRWSLPNPTNGLVPWRAVERGPQNLSDLILFGWAYLRDGTMAEPGEGHRDDEAAPDAGFFRQVAAMMLSGQVRLFMMPLMPRWAAPLRRAVIGLGRAWLRRRWRQVEHTMADPDARRSWQVLHFGIANALGWLEATPWSRGYDHLDDQDYRAWLERYLVDDGGLTLAGPLPKVPYDAQFSYVDGKADQPSIAAGASLRILVRMLTYWRGALFWKMQAGMGDIVFAPLYEVLKRRGVRFRFFHRAERVVLNGFDDAVTEVHLAVQARPADPTKPYAPLIDVGGLPCWPVEPDWDQLEDGPASKANGVDYEDPTLPGIDTLTWRQGVDFDELLLAVPIGVIETLAPDLRKNARWEKAFDTAATVATQALQVWFSRPTNQMGSPQDSWMSMYVGSAMSSVGEESHLLPTEAWAPGGPNGLIYACGACDEKATPTTGEPLRLLREGLAPVLPGAMASGGTMDPEALWPPLPAGTPIDHTVVAQQYARYNTRPSERYHITLPGTTVHRIPPHDTEIDHLTVAGDWTRTGLDLGNIEATTLSGRIAAAAIRSGSLARLDVPREGPYAHLPHLRKAPDARRPTWGFMAVFTFLVFMTAASALSIYFVDVPPHELPDCAPVDCLEGAFAGTADWGYTASVSLFAVPCFLLLIWAVSSPLAKHQWRAIGITTAAVFGMGFMLDTFLAGVLFAYPNPDAVMGIRLPGLGFEEVPGRWYGSPTIACYPVEELLFYGLGGLFMVLGYVFGDHEVFARYQPSRRDLEVSADVPKHFLKKLGAGAVAAFLLLWVAKVGIAWLRGVEIQWDAPLYMGFLVAIGVIPPLYVLPSTYRLVNWRAFCTAFLVLLFVSLMWEVTLGLPYGYWGYEPKFMLGVWLTPWTNGPVELVVMWAIACFAVAMLYEHLTYRFELALAE